MPGNVDSVTDAAATGSLTGPGRSSLRRHRSWCSAASPPGASRAAPRAMADPGARDRRVGHPDGVGGSANQRRAARGHRPARQRAGLHRRAHLRANRGLPAAAIRGNGHAREGRAAAGGDRRAGTRAATPPELAPTSRPRKPTRAWPRSRPTGTRNFARPIRCRSRMPTTPPAAWTPGSRRSSRREHNVQRLEQLAGYTKIYAPFDGVITARNTDVGALIDSGASGGAARELFHIASTDRLRVFVNVPQTHSRAAQPGHHRRPHADRVPGPHVHGHAGAHGPDHRRRVADAAGRTRGAEPDGRTAAGLVCRGALQAPDADDDLSLPVNTLMFRSEGLRVAVVGTGDKVTITPVTLGRDFGTEVEIVSGLNRDDRVVVNPPDSLEDGQVVRIAAPAASGGEARAPTRRRRAGRTTPANAAHRPACAQAPCPRLRAMRRWCARWRGLARAHRPSTSRPKPPAPPSLQGTRTLEAGAAHRRQSCEARGGRSSATTALNALEEQLTVSNQTLRAAQAPVRPGARAGARRGAGRSRRSRPASASRERAERDRRGRGSPTPPTTSCGSMPPTRWTCGAASADDPREPGIGPGERGGPRERQPRASTPNWRSATSQLRALDTERRIIETSRCRVRTGAGIDEEPLPGRRRLRRGRGAGRDTVRVDARRRRSTSGCAGRSSSTRSPCWSGHRRPVQRAEAPLPPVPAVVPAGAALRGARTPPGHRRRRAASRRRQRADRRRASALFPVIALIGHRRGSKARRSATG